MIDAKDVSIYRYLISELRKDPSLHKVVHIYPEEIIKLVESYQTAISERSELLEQNKQLSARCNTLIMENINLRDELCSIRK